MPAPLLPCAVLLAILLAACSPSPDPEAKAAAPAQPTATGHRFLVQYRPPDDPALRPFLQQLQTERWLEQAASALSETFILPRDVTLRSEQCGEANAFYDPQQHSITLCYEMMAELQQQARAQQLDAAAGQQFMDGVLSFVFMHELGHALTHVLELPVTGKEEDAVDQLATLSILDSAENDQEVEDSVAQIGHVASWFELSASGDYGADAFADSHSLDEQRFYNVMCWLYGAKPDDFGELVKDGTLPQERAEGCADEYGSIARAWGTLLAPHLKPEAAAPSSTGR